MSSMENNSRSFSLIGWIDKTNNEGSAVQLDIVELNRLIKQGDDLGLSKRLVYGTTGNSEKFQVVWDFKDIMSYKALPLRSNITDLLSSCKSLGTHAVIFNNGRGTFDNSNYIKYLITLDHEDSNSWLRLSSLGDSVIIVRLIYGGVNLEAKLVLHIDPGPNSKGSIILSDQLTSKELSKFFTDLKEIRGGLSYITKSAIIEFFEDLVSLGFFRDNPDLNNIIEEISSTRRRYFRTSPESKDDHLPF